jgi:hypothetical protein
VLKDGNSSKSNQRAKIHNPSGQERRGRSSPLPLRALELAPALFRIGSFSLRWFAKTTWSMANRRESRANGLLPNACASRAMISHEKRQTEEKTLITRHRSSSCGEAHLADGGSSTGLRDSTAVKTRDTFGPIRSLAHCSGIVTLFLATHCVYVRLLVPPVCHRLHQCASDMLIVPPSGGFRPG